MDEGTHIDDTSRRRLASRHEERNRRWAARQQRPITAPNEQPPQVAARLRTTKRDAAGSSTACRTRQLVIDPLQVLPKQPDPDVVVPDSPATNTAQTVLSMAGQSLSTTKRTPPPSEKDVAQRAVLRRDRVQSPT